MGTPAERAQHPRGVCLVEWLAENLGVKNDSRIRAEHDGGRPVPVHRLSLRQGQSQDVTVSAFTIEPSLVDIGDHHFEVNGGGAEQFGTAR